MWIDLSAVDDKFVLANNVSPAKFVLHAKTVQSDLVQWK